MALDGGDVFPAREENKPIFGLGDPLILGIVVFCACLFGIYTRPVGFLATVWPANAVMLGFLLLRPNSARASGWLAAIFAYLAADLLTGSTLTKTVILSLANLVGVGTAYLVFIRMPVEAIRLRLPSSMLYIALASAAGASAVGVVGAIANPLLFGGGSISGCLFWFATEFVNYLAILPVILAWPLSRVTTDKTEVTDSLSAYSGLPVAALVLSCLAAMIIGGPGAIAFPVPALLWCGLVYAVFPTAVLTLIFGCWALIIISAGYLPNLIGPADEMSLVSIRLGASLIALAPVTLATVMQSRNELVDMLRRSRQRLDLTLDAGGIVGTWALDIRGTWESNGYTLADMLGMKREKEHRGLDDIFSAAIHPADRARVLSTLKEAIVNGTDYQCRFRTITRQGEIHCLIASGKPVGYKQGNAEQFAGIVIDVTEHAETEAALHQSNLRFHIITESIPQIVWSTDAYGHHDYFNHRWTEFTGIEVKATDQESWKALVHPDDWPLVEKAWAESLASGKTYDIDYRLRHHDDSYRWMKVLAKPIRDSDGSITRWYGTSTDIDDAKHLELERELVAHELDHRIKNLFALVNGLVSLSAREEPALRPLVKSLSARLNALHQAHGLIHGKAGSGTDTLQVLLRQSLSPYEESGTGNISIIGMDMTINIDAFKSMALVVHELITNSAKYGALSQKEGRLQVSLQVAGERLTITWDELFSGKLDVEEKSGFGSKLFETIVEIQLRGSLTRNLRRDGLNVVIDLPRSVIEDSEHPG